jgi:hypothetical protein
MRCAAEPVDPAWLDDELAELERLVEDGDRDEVVARLAALLGGAPAGVGSERHAARGLDTLS